MGDEPAAGTQASEHHIRVRRTARYYTLGGDGELSQLWVVCHGFGQLARDFIRPFEAIASPARLIVAPEALNRYYVDARPVRHGPDAHVGATWMTREDREHDIDDYVAYLDAVRTHVLEGRDDAALPAVFALGFSQGAAAAARWAVRGAQPVQHLIVWGAGLPPELRLAPALFRDARLSIVLGERDGAVGDALRSRLRDQLANAGVSARFLAFPGGHHLHGETLRLLAEEG
jgi:predicted esterase